MRLQECLSVFQRTLSKQSGLCRKSVWDKICNCNVVDNTYILVLLHFLQSSVSFRNSKHLKSHSSYHKKVSNQNYFSCTFPKEENKPSYFPLNTYTYSTHTEICVLCSMLVPVLCAKMSKQFFLNTLSIRISGVAFIKHPNYLALQRHNFFNYIWIHSSVSICSCTTLCKLAELDCCQTEDLYGTHHYRLQKCPVLHRIIN